MEEKEEEFEVNESYLVGMYACHEIVDATIEELAKSVDNVAGIYYSAEGAQKGRTERLSERRIMTDVLLHLRELFHEKYDDKLDKAKAKIRIKGLD